MSSLSGPQPARGLSGVAFWATRAIFIRDAFLADEGGSRSRQGSAKSGTRSARSARTACRIERACVVGTTREKHIRSQRKANTIRRSVARGSAGRGVGHAGKDRDQPVGGGQPQDFGHGGLRGYQGENPPLPVPRPVGPQQRVPC